MELSEERGLAQVMEDGAPIHRCKTAKAFRSSVKMDVFEHPAQSPDMNPIEHLWYQLKRKINHRERRPHNVKELKRALLEEWEKIDQDLINSLIDSMPRRVEALLGCKGTSTRY